MGLYTYNVTIAKHIISLFFILSLGIEQCSLLALIGLLESDEVAILVLQLFGNFVTILVGYPFGGKNLTGRQCGYSVGGGDSPL